MHHLRYVPSHGSGSSGVHALFILCPQAIDLLKKFLVYDSCKRIGASEVSTCLPPRPNFQSQLGTRLSFMLIT